MRTPTLPATSQIRAKSSRPLYERKLTVREAKSLLNAPADGFDGTVRDDVRNALNGIDESTLNDRLVHLLRNNKVTELRRQLVDVKGWAECAIETLDKAAARAKPKTR